MSPKEHQVKNLLSLYADDSEKPTQYWDPFHTINHLSPVYESYNGHVRFRDGVKIAGYSIKELKGIEEVYNLMIPEHLDKSIQLGNMVLMHRRNPQNASKNILESRLDVCCTLHGKGNRMYYYRRSMVESGITNGKISHASTWWEDLSYLSSNRQLHYKAVLPNAEYYDLEIPEISQYQGVLSNREVEVLRLLARGLNSSDVGRILKITKNTVNTHRRRMLSKLEVANTPELIAMARDMGLY